MCTGSTLSGERLDQRESSCRTFSDREGEHFGRRRGNALESSDLFSDNSF